MFCRGTPGHGHRARQRGLPFRRDHPPSGADRGDTNVNARVMAGTTTVHVIVHFTATPGLRSDNRHPDAEKSACGNQISRRAWRRTAAIFWTAIPHADTGLVRPLRTDRKHIDYRAKEPRRLSAQITAVAESLALRDLSQLGSRTIVWRWERVADLDLSVPSGRAVFLLLTGAGIDWRRRNSADLDRPRRCSAALQEEQAPGLDSSARRSCRDVEQWSGKCLFEPGDGLGPM